MESESIVCCLLGDKWRKGAWFINMYLYGIRHNSCAVVGVFPRLMKVTGNDTCIAFINAVYCVCMNCNFGLWL